MTSINQNAPRNAANDTEPVAKPSDHVSQTPPRPGFDINDPATVRLLRIAVIVLGVILVAGFATVLARIAYLATGNPILSSAPTGTATITTDLALPNKAHVTTMSLNGNHLAVHYESPQGNGIRIINTKTGAVENVLTITTPVPSD